MGTGDRGARGPSRGRRRSEEHTSELQSRLHLVCRLLLEKKKNTTITKSSLQIIKDLTCKLVTNTTNVTMSDLLFLSHLTENHTYKDSMHLLKLASTHVTR